MIKRFNIGVIRFVWSINTVVQVKGVNSYLGKGQHIIMWDFDHTTFTRTKDALRIVQVRYALSDIHILETKKKHNYCAYCFTSVTWQRALEILAATDNIDMKYLKWCAFRGRMTLRVTPKMGRASHIAGILPGYGQPDADVFDLKSWTLYETVGGKEYWLKQIRNMRNWLIHLIYR